MQSTTTVLAGKVTWAHMCRKGIVQQSELDCNQMMRAATFLGMMGPSLIRPRIEGQRLQGMQQPVREGLEGMGVDGACRAACSELCWQ